MKAAIIALMYWLAKNYLRIRGWRIEGSLPPDPKIVVIGAPHTSNLDFVVFLGVLGHLGVRATFIGKHTLFRGPLGWVMRKLGGIPVQRDRPEGLVEQVVEAFAQTSHMILVLAPEGTRSRGTSWKTGFHHIASSAGLPIVPASINGPDRVATIGAPMWTSDDIDADMDRLREFYAGIEGMKPGNENPIRLAEEDPIA